MTDKNLSTKVAAEEPTDFTLDASTSEGGSNGDFQSGENEPENRRRSKSLQGLLSKTSDVGGEGGESCEDALGAWTSILMVINVLSVGYILLPSAFAQGGLLLGTLCLAFVSMQSIVTGIYVLEACARAEVLKVSMYVGSYHSTATRNLQELDEENTTPTRPKVPRMRSRRYLPHSHSIRVHQRTFELSELCRTFMGRWQRNFFTFTSAGDLYGITWTLAAVFGSSLSEHLPMGSDWDYHFYILIFMTITIPVSCMRIVSQVPIQILFLVGRTLMLCLMLGTLCAAFAADGAHFGIQQSAARETPLANFSAIVTVMQLSIFSTAFQFAVPGLTAETENKSAMVNVITRSVSYIYATNLILGLFMAVYFGAATEEASNLNWLYYHGGTWDGEGEFTRAWWATGISSCIVLFAALDGLAVYPLVAVSLGDILMGACYEDDVHEMQENWKVRLIFRLFASIPQAIGSLFLKDLGVIAKFAGVFTLLSYTVCPSYLAIKSREEMRAAKLPTTTNYSIGIFSSDMASWILIILSCFLIVGVLVDSFYFGVGASDVNELQASSNGTISTDSSEEVAGSDLFD